MMMIICVMWTIVAGIALAATQDSLIIAGIVWLATLAYQLFMLVRVCQLLVLVIMVMADKRRRRYVPVGFWRNLAEEEFFFARFRQNRRMRKWCRKNGASRRIRHLC